MSAERTLFLFQSFSMMCLVMACGRREYNNYYYASTAERDTIVKSRYIRQSEDSPAPEAKCGKGVYLTNLEPNNRNRTKTDLARLIYGSNWWAALMGGKLDHSFGFNLKYWELENCNKSGLFFYVYRKDINLDELDEYTVAKNEASTCRSGRGVMTLGLLLHATLWSYDIIT